MGGAARDVVEVAGRVDGHGDLAASARLEQVKLDLGVRVEREARVGRLRQRALEHVAQYRRGGLAVGRAQVAEHARGGIHVAAPRQHLERRRIRVREQVALLHAGEPLDRGAVEADPLAEGAFGLSRCDCDGLEGADDVREPQTHELHTAFLDRAKYEILLLVHASQPNRPRAHHSSRRSSSSHALVRSRMISGARAASAAVLEGPGPIDRGRLRPVLDLARTQVVPVGVTHA